MKREQTKIYSKESEAPSTGGLWELFLFAVFFVVLFSVIARTAHAAPRKGVSSPLAVSETTATAQAVESSASESAAKASRSDSSAAESQPIHPVGQATSIPSDALPQANISTTLATPLNEQAGWASKLTVETSTTVSPDDKSKYGGWYQVSTGYSNPKTNIAAGISLGWFQEYSYKNDDHTNGDLDNPVATVSKTWKDKTDFGSRILDSVTLGLIGVAGTSHESARRTFVGGTGISVGVAKAIRKLHLGEAFTYSRGFYNYDIRDDGTVNAPNVLKSKTDLSFDLTEKLALSVSTLLSYAISFQNVGRTTELSSISLDYSPTPRFGVSAGVSTERGTVSEDGTMNHIALYDQNVAQAFLDLSVNF